jgi:receptor protein-tyrosine kinase
MGMISVSPEGETSLIDITAVSAHPQETADVANAFAKEFILYRREVDQGIVETARTTIQDQLDQMTTVEKNSERGLMLGEKAENLRILKEMQTGGFEIAQTAETPNSPFSPQRNRTILLALLVGLGLGIGLAFLMDALDKRIKDEETMEREFGLPVLASVPDVGRRRIRGAKRSPIFGFQGGRSPLIEPFRTLRSNLQYFEVDGRLGTILITSALAEEGKSLTTINLALSLAMSGARVIIVEADLRRPTIHTHLGLSNDVGVSSVLAGTHTFTEAVQLVLIEDFSPPDTRRDPGAPEDSTALSRNLYCITSGPLPPNPAELAGSARMREFLDKAAQTAEYVLVDSPPLLMVADSLALAGQVDAVLLTARMNRTTVDEAREVRALLARIGAHPIGVVAIGVDRASGYYRYGYYAAPEKAKA